MQAILKDPNPYVIVYVVFSFFIVRLEKFDIQGGQLGIEDIFLFLCDSFAQLKKIYFGMN